MCFILANYVFHCTWVTSEAYSSPSIVLSAKTHNGDKIIFDDFREAYYWLRYNTPEDAKVMSWWDYGYQITAMANRTILVDNNTWNNTHISRVGQVRTSFFFLAQIGNTILIEFIFYMKICLTLSQNFLKNSLKRIKKFNLKNFTKLKKGYGIARRQGI
jgi:hypothetical protein